MKRCLIIGCSEAKLDTPGDIPAIERYDGPPFRVLRRFLKNGPPGNSHGELTVFILSAEFGLIRGEQLIPVYDRRMTNLRAEELRSGVLEVFKDKIAGQDYTELFLSMGKTYLLTLTGYETLLSPATKVSISDVTAGRKLTELKSWLTGEDPATQLTSSSRQATQNGQLWRRTNQAVNLRGVELDLTSDQALQRARQLLAVATHQASQIKDWYVLIDGMKVAPKWLTSQLTNVPVSKFDASEARRVLQALGIEVYQANK